MDECGFCFRTCDIEWQGGTRNTQLASTQYLFQPPHHLSQECTQSEPPPVTLRSSKLSLGLTFSQRHFGDAGGPNVFFHVKSKGNVKGLTMGQRVSYTEISNTKVVRVENVKPIEGVCLCVCAFMCLQVETGIESQIGRRRPHTHRRSFMIWFPFSLR
jgi:hypothetical protein